MSNPRQDAIRDMSYEGLDVSRLNDMNIEDIVDPIIEYGFQPVTNDFIDMRRRRCDALGALVLGIGLENRFKNRSDRGLLATLAAEYNVSETFLEGVEAGFALWTHMLSLPCYVADHSFRKGYMVGRVAWRNLMNPPH